MSVRLHAYCFGDASAPAGGGTPVDFCRLAGVDARRLSQMDADSLNGLAADASAEFFAFWDRAPGSTDVAFREAVTVLENNAKAAAAIVFDETTGLVEEIWRHLPPQLASLACAVDRGTAVVFRQSEFEQFGRFQDVGRPVWDWLIRASRDDRPILSVGSGPGTALNVPDAAELPALVPARPGKEKEWLSRHLSTVDVAGLVSADGSDPDATAFEAGLYQIHDFLEESHRLSQSIEGRGRQRSGDYWHAIMHRREPDYSNSKYWFRSVGTHPVFAELGPIAANVLTESGDSEAQEWQERLRLPSGWDPFAFVDLCEQCRRSPDTETLTEVARKVQLAEMLLLLKQTFADAAG